MSAQVIPAKEDLIKKMSKEELLHLHSLLKESVEKADSAWPPMQSYIQAMYAKYFGH